MQTEQWVHIRNRNSFLRFLGGFGGFPVFNKSANQRIKIKWNEFYQMKWMFQHDAHKLLTDNNNTQNQWSVWHDIQRKTEIKLDCLLCSKIEKGGQREREQASEKNAI